MQLLNLFLTLLSVISVAAAAEARYILIFSKGQDTPSKIINNVERKLRDLGVRIDYKYNTVIRGFALTLDTNKVQALDDINDESYPFFLEPDQTVTINE